MFIQTVSVTIVIDDDIGVNDLIVIVFSDNQWHILPWLRSYYRYVRSLVSLLSSSMTKHQQTKHFRQSAFWNRRLLH